MFSINLGLKSFFVMFFLFAGCTVKQSPVNVEPVQSYQSDAYALHRLEPATTFTSLAEIYYGDPEQVWRIHDENDGHLMKPGEWVVVPMDEHRRGGIYDDGFQGIPILCYHKFGNSKSSPMEMSPKAFAEQMRYLKENGFRSVSPEDLISFFQYQKQLPKRSIMITIDDGYRSVFEVAYPILKKYGFTATLLIYTDYVGISSKAITWDQLKILKNEGFSIGSHSVVHSDLTTQGPEETFEDFEKRLDMEIIKSKQILDQNIGQDTLLFAYPFGKFDDRIIEMVRRAGYKLAVTVERGNNPFFSNPFDLKRDMILKQDIKSFVRRLIIFNRVSLR